MSQIGGSQVAVTTGRIVTEGDDLYYEVRGQGPPLVMIAGGGGDAGFYSLVAPLLADEYTVITYDRRGNSRSTRHDPQHFAIDQQARDAIAVLRACGETTAFFFGNSGGAIIALELARAFPEAIRAVVAHEPPLLRLLPDSERWLRFFAGLHSLSFRLGAGVAMLRFALSTHIPLRAYRAVPRDCAARMGQNHTFFVRQEMLPFVNYQPDLAAIKRNNVRVYPAVGAMTLAGRRYYGRPAQILAIQLGRAPVTFPGHHLSYVDMPAEWSAVLRAVLRETNPPPASPPAHSA